MRPGVVVLLVVALAVLGCVKTPGEAQTRTQIVLLGTGTPYPDPGRFGPSVAIVVDERPYLVDVGSGVVRRTVEATRRGVKGLSFDRLQTAFLTHLHSDHTLGLPDLILTPWVLGRTEPLVLYGPPGLQSMAEHIVTAYSEDIEVRTSGLEGLAAAGHQVIVHEVTPGVVYRDPELTVTAFAVGHGSWRQALGYRFETPDRTIVISGDAAPSPSIAEHCNGCDVLLHEVYSEAGFSRLGRASQDYYRAFHTSTHELAELASRARPKLLVLYHQLYVGGSTEQGLLEEIESRYDGRVVSGRDLQVW
jgi:ribonuclease BN (tRNA processing enzyme)